MLLLCYAAIWQCLRMLGPTVGYLLASYALNKFVAPELTPSVDSNDPRWVGAWWYGESSRDSSHFQHKLWPKQLKWAVLKLEKIRQRNLSQIYGF